jgi:hypothetical protein
MNGMTPDQIISAQNAGLPPAVSAGPGVVPPAVTPGTTPPPPGGQGWFGSMSPMAQHATISAGSQLLGGLLSGYGADKAADEERKYAEQQQAQYSANMGTPIIGSVADRAMQPRSPVAFDQRYEQIAGSPLGVSGYGLINLARA